MGGFEVWGSSSCGGFEFWEIKRKGRSSFVRRTGGEGEEEIRFGGFTSDQFGKIWIVKGLTFQVFEVWGGREEEVGRRLKFGRLEVGKR